MSSKQIHRVDLEGGSKLSQRSGKLYVLGISTFVISLAAIGACSIYLNFGGSIFKFSFERAELHRNTSVKRIEFPLDANGFFNTPDNSVEPCHDFYQFACGSGHRNLSFDLAVNLQFHGKIREMLREPIDEKDMASYNHAKLYFSKCLEFKPDIGNASFPGFLSSATNTASTTAPDTLSDQDDVRLEKCLDNVENLYKLPLGHKYLTNEYGENTFEFHKVLKEAEMISRNVQESCNRRVQNFNLDFDCTKVEVCLGFPAWILNRTKVEEEYNLHPVKELSDSEDLDQHFSARAHVDHLIFKNKSKKCALPDFEGGVGAKTLTSERLSKIAISMGYIQPPFFTLTRNRAFNYGFFGGVVGHECFHSLYRELEHQFGGESRSIQTSLTQCLKTQFGTFSMKDETNQDIFVNEERTLEENMADHVALRTAFEAYKLADIRPKAETLPGAYSDDQQFFLGFAQNFCDSTNIEDITSLIDVDEHSPGMFRVLGTFQSSEEFAQAWNCPVGSRMNPHPDVHTKCVLN